MSFDAGYWEDRYRRGQGAGRTAPGPALVAEVAGLPPGTSLDVGCGTGGDALWLASRGWRVTAVDVSATALEHGRRAAPEVDWVEADLRTWTPVQRYDLVTCSYVHVPGPQEELFARVASWVAPGGTLLVVAHAHAHAHAHDGHGHGHGHAEEPRPEGAEVGLAQVTGALTSAEWELLVAEPRTHLVHGRELHDVVVRARRTAWLSAGSETAVPPAITRDLPVRHGNPG